MLSQNLDYLNGKETVQQPNAGDEIEHYIFVSSVPSVSSVANFFAFCAFSWPNRISEIRV